MTTDATNGTTITDHRTARASQGRPTVELLRASLAFAVWLYFGLNFAFFRFPWPWQTWTARTPNALVYTACTTLLVLAAVRILRRSPQSSPSA